MTHKAYFTAALFIGIFFASYFMGFSDGIVRLTRPALAQDCSCENSRGPLCCTNGFGWSCPALGCSSAWTTCGEDCCEVEHNLFTRPHIWTEFNELERFMTLDLMAGYILPGLMGMTEEFTVVAMHQVLAIGSFFDAQMEMSQHRLLQEIQADAHKDYHPSEGVCTFATSVRSLAATERFVDLTQTILSQRALSRHLGRLNDNGAYGRKTDLGEQLFTQSDDSYHNSGRLKQFQEQYCNPVNNKGTMRLLCGNGNLGASGRPGFIDHDTDYSDVFMAPRTLDVDFMEDLNAATVERRLSDGEENVFALAKNLYGHNVSLRLSNNDLALEEDFLNGVQETIAKRRSAFAFQRFRSLVAKRAVVENSYNAIVAMKSTGTPASSIYLNAILSELGMGDQQISEFLSGNPSYYAQMEILAKKVFQNPQFFINLYDKPVNVERQFVAVKGIGIMQNFDMFETQLRMEMLSSLLVELALIERQKGIETRMVNATQ